MRRQLPPTSLPTTGHSAEHEHRTAVTRVYANWHHVILFKRPSQNVSVTVFVFLKPDIESALSTVPDSFFYQMQGFAKLRRVLNRFDWLTDHSPIDVPLKHIPKAERFRFLATLPISQWLQQGPILPMTGSLPGRRRFLIGRPALQARLEVAPGSKV